MKSILKYPFVALMLLLFSFIFMQEDNSAELTQELYESSQQYQHAISELQKDMCFASHQLTASPGPARLLKKNKRNICSARYHLGALKSGKHNLSYFAYNHSYHKSVSTTSLVECGNQLTMFCKLII
jgi:hypothetical protein